MECEFSCPQTALVLCFCRSQSISESTNSMSVNQLSTLSQHYKAVKAGSDRGEGWVSCIPAPFPRKSRVLNSLQKLMKINVRCRLAVSIVILNLHVF